jgi:hypothetical protein
MSTDAAVYKFNGGGIQLKDDGSYLAKLGQQPKNDDIKINDKANKAKYIPIEVIEAQLDYFYNGMWSIENFTWQVVANEIVGKLELVVMHPSGMMLRRTGAAAVQIQLKSKDKGGSGDITEIRDKYVNTLTKDFPHLKSECLKNAAKSLGQIFGRNLNRGYEDGLGEMDTKESILQDIKECGSISDLKSVWASVPKQMQKDKEILNLFSTQKIKLNGNS